MNPQLMAAMSLGLSVLGLLTIVRITTWAARREAKRSHKHA